MPNTYFQFKQFTIHQDRSAMKVSTDACIFGAWIAGICASFPSSATALDIGSGTGLLSLMVAQKFSGVITAVEVDPSAASQASENFLASPWASRLTLVAADVRAFTGSYDVVFSNPPFFEHDLRGPSAERNQARHDDTLGFTSLLASVRRLLAPSGVFGVLIPYHRLEEFIALFVGFTCQRMTLVRQTPKHGFFRAMLIMKRGSSEVASNATASANHVASVSPIVVSSIFPVIQNELTIQDGGAYTPECETLLKPYYLYL
jgi:tRNA1Val (adenine37-N6)-methyltransferase